MQTAAFARRVTACTTLVVSLLAVATADTSALPSSARDACPPPTGSAPDHPAVWRPGTFYLRCSRSTGTADVTWQYGDPSQSEVPLLCDWDGDGLTTPGVVRGTQWLTTDAADPGTAEHVFLFGDPGDVPLCGDWDGDGSETPGLMRVHVGGLVEFFLNNSVRGGVAERHVSVASVVSGTETPLVGRWDETGPGPQQVGWYRDGRWFLVGDCGAADCQADLEHSFGFGDPSDRGVAGQWGSGGSDPAVFRSGRWYIGSRLLLDPPPRGSCTCTVFPNFDFGDAGDVPLVWHPTRP